ncbi:MAG: hypothetical protein JRG92_09975 [Deltaproteobacteria bacterium]|jgi:hypothetical protein|nr:hypothetical protein [Deltaproteobacteria bacterium]MBW2698939.1 hypothetical protein [Deltaproteobacteria bacterium]
MSRVYDYESAYDYEPAYEPDVVVHRAPSPGVAAVLSVILPGLGQVYSGRLLAGGLWFLATTCAYSAVLLPGFLVHGLCIWSAYTTCPSR